MAIVFGIVLSAAPAGAQVQVFDVRPSQQWSVGAGSADRLERDGATLGQMPPAVLLVSNDRKHDRSDRHGKDRKSKGKRDRDKKNKRDKQADKRDRDRKHADRRERRDDGPEGPANQRDTRRDEPENRSSVGPQSAPATSPPGTPGSSPDPGAAPEPDTGPDQPSRDPSEENDDGRNDLRFRPQTTVRAASLFGGGPDEGALGAAAYNEFAGDFAFGDMLSEVAAVLGASLEVEDPRERRRAAAALGRFNAAIAQAMPVLFDALCSRDMRVQRRAAVVLAGIDDYAENIVPALSERVTSDPDPAVARASAQALGDLGVYAIDGLPTLVQALDHQDLGVRYYAGDSVGSVDDQMTAAARAVRAIGLRCGEVSGVAVQQLASKLQPDRSAFRQQATASLAGIGEAAQVKVAALNAELEGGDPDDRQRVVQALSDAARFSSAAVASLAKEGNAPEEGWEVAVGGTRLTSALDDQQGQVRQAVTEGIGVASKEVTNASSVLQQAPKYDRAVRRATNRALRTIDEYTRVAVPALLAALKDDDVEVRRAAAQAIGELGPEAGATAPALVDAVKSEPVEVRAEAALALGRIHGEPAVAVPTLAEALDHPEPAVRYQAARALGLLAGGASPAVPKLQAALEQPDVALRYQAARALMAIDPSAANGPTGTSGTAREQEIAQLLSAVKSEDPERRQAAGQVLSNLGPAAVATLPELAAGLADAVPEQRRQLATTMREIASSALADVPALVEQMQAGGPGADRAAAALGKLGRDAKRAKQDLIQALDDPDTQVRLTVAEVLGDISEYTSQVIGALMAEALEQDDDALAALEQHAAGG